MMCDFCFTEHDPSWCPSLFNARFVGYSGLLRCERIGRGLQFSLDNWRGVRDWPISSSKYCYIKFRKYLGTLPNDPCYRKLMDVWGVPNHRDQRIGTATTKALSEGWRDTTTHSEITLADSRFDKMKLWKDSWNL